MQGTWTLHVIVDGASGRGETDVAIVAVAPPAIPIWLGWLIGLIPVYGLFAFLLSQHGRKKEVAEKDEITVVPDNVTPPVGA